jgi:hypothetical protein
MKRRGAAVKKGVEGARIQGGPVAGKEISHA